MQSYATEDEEVVLDPIIGLEGNSSNSTYSTVIANLRKSLIFQSNRAKDWKEELGALAFK